MQPGDPLFDTNAVIDWLRVNPALWRRYVGRDKCVSVVTLGELFFGAAKSPQAGANRQTIRDVTATSQVVGVNAGVSRCYGDLKQQLRAAGTPIPDNDLWIAATAIEHGLTLVSRDKHFQSVTGLACESW